MIEFTSFSKIPRLFRDVVITEKIDGTNAAVGVQEFPFGWHVGGTDDQGVSHVLPDDATLVFSDWDTDDGGMPNLEYLVYAQSHSRIITPGKQDNHGFAGWVWDNASALVSVLGPGLHFGEWWGSGINRGYGLTKGEKRFSLFNTKRWSDPKMFNAYIKELDVVPILYEGPFSTLAVKATLEQLRLGGSQAQNQFMNPEGVVVYHTAGNVMFKATIENDDVPKRQTTDWRPDWKDLELAAA